jgi:hypothetical protein
VLEWSAGIAIGDCIGGSVRKCEQSDGVLFRRIKFSCRWVKRLDSKIEKSFPGTSGLGADGACFVRAFRESQLEEGDDVIPDC